MQNNRHWYDVTAETRASIISETLQTFGVVDDVIGLCIQCGRQAQILVMGRHPDDGQSIDVYNPSTDSWKHVGRFPKEEKEVMMYETEIQNRVTKGRMMKKMNGIRMAS
jgi:hypothetical protein